MKRRNFFIENYKKCWKFFLECRWYFVFAFGIFALTFLIGFAFPIFFREEIFRFIEMLMLEIGGKGVLELIGFIFLNNVWASFMAFVLGIGFGILPLVTCIANGYLLGFVARETVMVDGILTMWRILPHGVFELPAIIFSIGMGLKLGWSVVGGTLTNLKQKSVGADSRWSVMKDKRSIGYVFREGFRFFVFVVLPLLVVAGVIEGILIGFVN